MKGARCCQTLIATAARSGSRAMLRSTRRQRWTPSLKKVGVTSWGRDRAVERHITTAAPRDQELQSITRTNYRKSRRKPATLQQPSERAESKPREIESMRPTQRKPPPRNL